MPILSYAVFLFASFPAFADTPNGLSGIPVPWSTAHPGGWDAAAAAAAAGRPRPQTAQPNLFVTGIRVVDANDNPISPTPGVPFWVEIDWEYDNPVCTSYTLSRAVNGWTNVAPAINYGCGYTGATFWNHYWGPWLIYKAGTYPITVKVDAGNAIAESNESDNSMTINLVVGGSIIPQWALIGAEYGRTNLGAGTDVIVGTMDDAFDFLHPWFTGTDSHGRPRLVAAAQNALGPGGSPTNDFHSTGVLGIVLARGANNVDITGLAPDAQYVSAEFINRADLLSGTIYWRDADKSTPEACAPQSPAPCCVPVRRRFRIAECGVNPGQLQHRTSGFM